jgi:hypothetical protein
MEPKEKKKPGRQNVLSQIETIANSAKGTKFSGEFQENISTEALTVAETLDCNEIQAILFSVIFNLNFTRSSVDIEDMSNYMDCTPIMIVGHMNDLEGLCRLKVLCHVYKGSQQNRQHGNTLDIVSYFVNREVLEAMLNGKKYISEPDQVSDTYDLISKISELCTQHEKAQLSWEEMEDEIRSIITENEHLAFIRELRRYKLQFNDQLILFCLFDKFLDGDESADFAELIRSVFTDFRTQLEIRREFLDGTNALLSKDLVELEDGFFKSDRILKLSERGLDLLLGVDKTLFEKKKEKKSLDIILANEVQKKHLFYNPAESQQLSFLTEILMPGKYDKVLSRLKRTGMKTGFTVLFHGVPGVGKTESVFQIAKQTGRDIKMVTISETKSMWFGQSEKLIKGVFDQYRRQVEKSKITPILLFNEADGILSSRKQIGNSHVDQTENAIQNIILQEMEDMEGILIATTNLIQNLDKAFDRRFLYKIRFEKPDFKNRVLIWKDRIKGLSLDELKTVADKYEFTGGQIDNISRKIMMHKVLYGRPDLTNLEKFCEEEKLDGSNQKRIGYR